LRAGGADDLVLLHCVSTYPAPPADANLRVLDTLRLAFDCPVGYSDHTPGIAVAVAAVARGARVIEKHLTLDTSLPGPDHAASLEPDEFRSMVAAIRQVEVALGDGVKRCMPSERDTRDVARRSLAFGRALPAGSVLTDADLVLLRPGTGFAPAERTLLVGRTLRREAAAGRLVRLEDLA
jgi:sialic acid synthase SpsE